MLPTKTKTRKTATTNLFVRGISTTNKKWLTKAAKEKGYRSMSEVVNTLVDLARTAEKK